MALFSARGWNREGASALLRGTLSASVGLALLTGALAGADANAYVVKRTSHGDLVHWETDRVEYTLDGSLANVEGSVDATQRAMGSWSGTVGAPDLAVKAPAADAPTKPGFDQKNGVFFMKNGYAPAGRALAITVLTYDNATGRILDADVIFNGSYRFAVLGESPAGDTLTEASGPRPTATDGIGHDDHVGERVDTVYDLHHVIAHELGHSLGMNDEMDRKDALMYRYSAPNDASMREPASDDIAGLAELYSTKLEGRGNGCGGATVAPKKPTMAASHVAMFGALTLLAFLLLRAKSDRRARLAFVFAAAAATVALLPSTSKDGRGVARASELAPGHARAKVLSTATSIEDGLIKTTFELATVACRASICPKLGHGATWGGTIGNITQEVGGFYAPANGSEVDVSFDKLPNALAPLSSPLAGRNENTDATVRVITRAN